MDYKFLTNLQEELALPDKGILSHVLQKDDHVNVTLFGFSAGEELSSHSAPTPAILYFLEGEANVQLGQDTVLARPALSSLYASHASSRHSRKNSRAYAPGSGEAPSLTCRAQNTPAPAASFRNAKTSDGPQTVRWRILSRINSQINEASIPQQPPRYTAAPGYISRLHLAG